MSDDLWPSDFSTILPIDPPQKILMEQAKNLGVHTDNVITGVVANIAAGLSPLPNGRSANFVYRFYISVPLMKYKYSILTIYYSVDGYPVFIDLNENIKTELKQTMELSAGKYQVNDDDEFKNFLRQVFATDKLRSILATLLGQALAE